MYMVASGIDRKNVCKLLDINDQQLRNHISKNREFFSDLQKMSIDIHSVYALSILNSISPSESSAVVDNISTYRDNTICPEPEVVSHLIPSKPAASTKPCERTIDSLVQDGTP